MRKDRERERNDEASSHFSQFSECAQKCGFKMAFEVRSFIKTDVVVAVYVIINCYN